MQECLLFCVSECYQHACFKYSGGGILHATLNGRTSHIFIQKINFHFEFCIAQDYKFRIGVWFSIYKQSSLTIWFDVTSTTPRLKFDILFVSRPTPTLNNKFVLDYCYRLFYQLPPRKLVWHPIGSSLLR